MLHVLVGRDCNNNCLFCMEADRHARARHIESQSCQDVRRMIDDYPDTDEILFTSGEPTLCPDLPRYISWAKERGFSRIGIITNGRRFAYEPFLEDLVWRGLNRVTISIHGHTAKLHDSLTRAPGSFRQTRTGLVNCTRLSRTHDLQVHTSTVLNRRNLPHLDSIHAMLRVMQVHETVFNVMMAKGRGAEHFDALMPRYTDVILAFQDLCAHLDADSIRRLRVVDMPPCLLLRLPRGIGGEAEEFDQFEPTGSTGLSGLEVLNAASDQGARKGRSAFVGRARALSERFSGGGARTWLKRYRNKASAALSGLRKGPADAVTLEALVEHDESASMASLRKTVSAAVLQEDRAYYVTHRSFKDRFLRVKGPPCQHCGLSMTCAGVWESYVDEFGWDEFPGA